MFTKEHLTGTKYDWKPGERTHANGEEVPTRRRFDRYNGNNVLYMLNLFNTAVASLTIHDGQRLEDLIDSELPLTETSEISVFNWLKKKFDASISMKSVK